MKKLVVFLMLILVSCLSVSVLACASDDDNYSINFMANNVLVQKVSYDGKSTNVTEPVIPEKEHYTGKWESYKLEKKSEQVVNAVYTPIEYTVTFRADGAEDIKKTYNIETMASFENPTVPTKENYTGEWESYELNFDNELVVNAVYTQIGATTFSVIFKADGEQVGDTQYYTMENKNINVPDVPEKDNYDGKWADYELNGGNKIINAVYTFSGITIKFDTTKIYSSEGKSVSITHKAISSIVIKSGSTISSLPTVENFSTATADYKGIIWVFVKQDGSLVEVKNGDVFNEPDFRTESGTKVSEITLCMQYTSVDKWTPNY